MLDPWKAIIDSWLEADKEAPRKQRHTSRRVYQRLVEEFGTTVQLRLLPPSTMARGLGPGGR